MLKSLLLWSLLAQGADIATTEIGMHRGCVERSYPMRSPVSFAVMKGGAAVSFSLLYKAGKQAHPKLLKGLAWGMLGSGVGAAMWNVRQLPRC